MRKLIAIALLTALCGDWSAAQTPTRKKEKARSSMKVVAGAKSKDGGTIRYRKVIKNGKVVEESGDPGILDLPGVPDLDELINRCKRTAEKVAKSHADGKSSSKSGSRRIVIENGKVVLDEAEGDDVPMPGEVKELIDSLKRDLGGALPTPKSGGGIKSGGLHRPGRCGEGRATPKTPRSRSTPSRGSKSKKPVRRATGSGGSGRR